MPRSRSEGVRLLPMGEAGIVVELGDAIDPALNARVQWLARAVAERLARDVVEVVPTYRSLLVVCDPLRAPRARLAAALRALATELPPDAAPEEAGRLIRLPACYGGAFGPDLEEVARRAGVSPADAVELHSSATYLVCMLGFTPGFPYLGGMPARLATPRLETPRTRIPAGSIGIGGAQTGIYPVESPGGWQLIGRTPIALFDASRQPPVFIEAGDYLRFVPIGVDEYHAIAGAVARGIYQVRLRDMQVD